MTQAAAGLGSAALYTPEILALTTQLAQWRGRGPFALEGSARSRTCGSSLTLSQATDADGKLVDLALTVQACAIGQAAAAIFANAAIGQNREGIEKGRAALATWLAGEGDPPDWPSIALLSAARERPGRHGAIMLPWDAACEALSSAANLG